jgi:hypothetical protein
MNESAPIRIFVGVDRSQMVGFEVLKYSILRHTRLPCVVHPMLDLPLPEPADPRNSKRTGFSFSRFAIPRLAGHQGRAIYLDADMQVFTDIGGLWNHDLGTAKVAIQCDLPAAAGKPGLFGGPPKRIRQCAVMVLDCLALDWDPERIIGDLGAQYSYEDLMQRLCILAEDEISSTLPFQWNSLEHYDETTKLIHYTDMNTQPWVSLDNPNGHVWMRELRRLIGEDPSCRQRIEQDVGLGYLRPSLLVELAMPVGEDSRLTLQQVKELKRLDKEARFEMHKEVYETARRRKQAILDYERRLAANG